MAARLSKQRQERSKHRTPAGVLETTIHDEPLAPQAKEITALPPELLSSIFLHLDDLHELLACWLVCSSWRRVSLPDAKWRALISAILPLPSAWARFACGTNLADAHRRLYLASRRLRGRWTAEYRQRFKHAKCRTRVHSRWVVSARPGVRVVAADGCEGPPGRRPRQPPRDACKPSQWGESEPRTPYRGGGGGG